MFRKDRKKAPNYIEKLGGSFNVRLMLKVVRGRSLTLTELRSYMKSLSNLASLIAMASTLIAMASNLLAMASSSRLLHEKKPRSGRPSPLLDTLPSPHRFADVNQTNGRRKIKLADVYSVGTT